MMSNALILPAVYLASLLPALALTWAEARRTKTPRAPLVRAAIVGALATIPISIPAVFVLPPIMEHVPAGLPRAAALAFVVASLMEEGGKLLALLVARRWTRRFDPPRLTALSVAIGFGFAIVEQALFMIGHADRELFYWGIRAVLTLPAHLAFGWCMGKMLERGGSGGIALAFLLPFVLHGLLDFTILGLHELSQR